MVTYTKVSPTMVNPRDIAGNAEGGHSPAGSSLRTIARGILLLLLSPTISLGFTILLLLRSPISGLHHSSSSAFPYLWASPFFFFFFFFFCFPQLHLWASPFFFFFFCDPQLYLWASLFFLLRSPAKSLGFTILLLLRSPAKSLGFTIWGEIFAYVTVFNLTIQVVTFPLRGLREEIKVLSSETKDLDLLLPIEENGRHPYLNYLGLIAKSGFDSRPSSVSNFEMWLLRASCQTPEIKVTGAGLNGLMLVNLPSLPEIIIHRLIVSANEIKPQ